MIELIFSLGIMSFLLWIGYKVTGVMFKACIWLFLCLPIALFLFGMGIVLCCTIILIPVGMMLFSAGGKVLFQAW